ncbi:MAG: orotidine-5'-phosphate decarboxylase [Acidimicrobiales bacterium]
MTDDPPTTDVPVTDLPDMDLDIDDIDDDGPWDQLVLALDTDDLVVAMRLAAELRPFFSTAKVGLELYSAVGPDAIGGLVNLGYDVFCDLKLHDIPTTVNKAATVIGALGASYLTVHTSGGVDMLRAGVEGFAEGARRAELPDPTLLGVTVLTSDADASETTLRQRLGVAIEAGCGGVVCSAPDLPTVRSIGPRLFTLVPGIRPAGTAHDDQARVATPRAAIDAGADLLVIGRAVTQAADPVAAAAAIVESLG